MRNFLLPVLAAVVLALLAGPTAALGQVPAPDPRGVDPNSPNPLVGVDFFVDREWAPAWRSYLTLRRQGRTGEAALMYKIARQPQFKWFGRWAGYASPYRTVRKYLRRGGEEQPLPGAPPAHGAAAHAARRPEDALRAAERNGLPRGRGLGLGARPHRGQEAPLH